VLPGLLDFERPARAGDHNRADPLAQRRIGHRNNRHVRDGGVRHQQVLESLAEMFSPLRMMMSFLAG